MPRSIALALTLLLLAPAAAHASSYIPAEVPQPDVVTVADSAAGQSLQLRGVPYQWAGSTPSGFDCSGFTRYVYLKLGITLPHSSYGQWDAGRHVSRSELLPGDLVFFDGLNHVGLYLGHGRFIHSPHTGTVVSIDSLNTGWYADTYVGAVRVRGSQLPRRHHHHAGDAKANRERTRLFGLVIHQLTLPGPNEDSRRLAPDAG